MFRPVVVPVEIEPLVRFVEETPPDRILDATLEKLRSGTSAKTLLIASALAVSRSTELPAVHHGGPIHQLCGLHAVYHTSQRLSGEWAYVPIIQSVALANKHVHSPRMGPYIMPEVTPLAGAGGGIEATKAAFLAACQRRSPNAVEAHLLWLLQQVSTDEIVDLVISPALANNPMDDHYFLYPMFTARALDDLGWEWAPILLRPAARYEALNPYGIEVAQARPDFAPLEALLTKYQLLEKEISQHSSASEAEAIGVLGARIGACKLFAEVPELLAAALANGLSLEGAGEALSIGGATIYLRTSSGNPMDVHLHTGLNVRRYLLQLPGVRLRTKLLALFTWHTGPEVRQSEAKMVWEAHPQGAQPVLNQTALLAAISESIVTQPEFAWKKLAPGVSVDNLVAVPQVQETLALAQQYADLRYDPMALFMRLAEISCHDDYAEMHPFKHHQAVIEEFYNTREPHRWVHLVGAVKAAAVAHGNGQTVFTQVRELLKI